MKLPRCTRTLAMASMLALAIVGVPATQVLAKSKVPTPQPKTCGFEVTPGNFEFYLPGEVYTTTNGNRFICGADGQWHSMTGLPEVPAQGSPSSPQLPSSVAHGS